MLIPVTPSADVSNIGGRRNRHFGLVVLAALGASDQVCEVSTDASLHAESNDTIGRCVRHRRPEKSPSSHALRYDVKFHYSL